jgi:hypothetical protein
MASRTESFRLKYDGEALAENAIDVSDLAPALLALSDLIQEANKIANDDRGGTISLKVKATSPGSFNIDIQALQTGWDVAADFLTGKNVTAIDDLLELLGIPGTALGLIQIYRFLRGRKPKKVEEKSGDSVEIYNEVDESVTINRNEYNFYLSPAMKKHLYKVLKPLEKEGIETVEFESGTSATKVQKSEIGYFQPSTTEDEPLQETVRDTFVNVSHVWLDNEAGKWKFKEGGNTTWSAVIHDQEFLKKLIKGEVSLSGADTLKVRVKQAQYRTDDGIKSEYEILQVLEHIKGAQQVPLDYDGPAQSPAT